MHASPRRSSSEPPRPSTSASLLHS
jgi:hypothetical protein